MSGIFLKKHTQSGKKSFLFPLLRQKQLWRHCRKTIAIRGIKFWLIVWERYMKTDIFSQSTISSKFLSRNVKSCFGNFAWFILSNGWKLSAQCLKIIEKENLGSFPEINPPGAQRASLTILLAKFVERAENFQLIVQEGARNCFFFSTKNLIELLLWTRESQLYTVVYNTFATLLQIFYWKSTNVKETFFLQE